MDEREKIILFDLKPYNSLTSIVELDNSLCDLQVKEYFYDHDLSKKLTVNVPFNVKIIRQTSSNSLWNCSISFNVGSDIQDVCCKLRDELRSVNIFNTIFEVSWFGGYILIICNEEFIITGVLADLLGIHQISSSNTFLSLLPKLNFGLMSVVSQFGELCKINLNENVHVIKSNNRTQVNKKTFNCEIVLRVSENINLNMTVAEDTYFGLII